MFASARPSLFLGIPAILAAFLAVAPAAQAPVASAFARQIHDLSESGGSFDTDNLISNEKSYLHVIPALRERRAPGGAYIGVGPDQNFSYIAAWRPSIAYIIDVRRDNLLLHLLFKALFALSETRADYLAHLFGRPPPRPSAQSSAAPIDDVVAAIEASKPARRDVEEVRRLVTARIIGFGVPLSPDDLATIDRFHRTFIEAGLSLKFETFGRPSRSYYPTYRDLLLETDRQGRRDSFLASEDDYEFVRSLEQRDLVIPVVGNLAGPTALAAIGRAVRLRGERVSVLYASNVELYLFQQGVFGRFADTVSALPRGRTSLLVRSIFSGPGVFDLPDTKPGYASASVVQPLDEFVNDYAARKYLTYMGLLAAHR